MSYMHTIGNIQLKSVIQSLRSLVSITHTLGIPENTGQTRGLTFYTNTVTRDELFYVSYCIVYLLKDMKKIHSNNI